MVSTTRIALYKFCPFTTYNKDNRAIQKSLKSDATPFLFTFKEQEVSPGATRSSASWTVGGHSPKLHQLKKKAFILQFWPPMEPSLADYEV